jgi:hypothetical protein
VGACIGWGCHGWAGARICGACVRVWAGAVVLVLVHGHRVGRQHAHLVGQGLEASAGLMGMRGVVLGSGVGNGARGIHQVLAAFAVGADSRISTNVLQGPRPSSPACGAARRGPRVLLADILGARWLVGRAAGEASRVGAGARRSGKAHDWLSGAGPG